MGKPYHDKTFESLALERVRLEEIATNLADHLARCVAEKAIPPFHIDRAKDALQDFRDFKNE